MFVFRIPEEVKEGLVKPVLEGAYSKADKGLVEKYFSDPKRQGNRQVFAKDPVYKTYWEELIGMPLPEDAEVWPKPTPSRETYGYVKDFNHGTIEPTA